MLEADDVLDEETLGCSGLTFATQVDKVEVEDTGEEEATGRAGEGWIGTGRSTVRV